MQINKKILLGFLLPLLSVSALHAADLCKNVYQEIVSGRISLSQIVKEKKSPFDVARQARAQDPKASNKLLDRVEEKLLTDEVVKIEELGGGVTTSYKVTFESGLKAAYKPVNQDRPNQPTREAVAYRISRLLNLDIVPPTVVRKIKGAVVPPELLKIEGSVQLFVGTAKKLEKGKDRKGGKILLFEGRAFDPDTILSGRRLRVFDWLINNHDRGSNAGNYLFAAEDGHVFGIDHSVAFVGHERQAREDKVPYYKKEFLDDPEFYQKLTSASREEITAALEGLNPVRIKEFFERYDQLIADYQSVLGGR